MSLATLSRMTGINKGHLSKVERGLAGLGDKNIAKVAEAMGVTTTDITQEEKP